LVLLIMAMLVVPLHPMLLDVFFTFNILVSVVVIMIAIGTKKPLDFSSFPSVLLFATMLRLALNVASTRVILVNGHDQQYQERNAQARDFEARQTLSDC